MGISRYDNGQVRLLRLEVDPSMRGDKNETTLAIYRRMNATNRAQCVEELTTVHMGLVFSMANQRRFTLRGLDYTDRVQEGFIGLMKAIQRFDQSRGIKFSTYAQWWVRQAIGRACWGSGFNGRAVRASYSADEFTLRVITKARRMSFQLGREPTDFELVDVMHDPGASKRMPRERFLAKVRAARERAAFTRIELDAPMRIAKSKRPIMPELADDRGTRVDRIIEAHDLVDMCRRILAGDAQLLDIFERRFPADGPPAPLSELALHLGVHRATASGLEAKMLKLLANELCVTRAEIAGAIAVCALTL